MVRVKICGITNLRDADEALRLGADALGFVFAESPRQLTLKEAQRITKRLAPWTSLVGVFVNEKIQTIRKIALECQLTAIQLHGDEPAAVLRQLSQWKIIKAFSAGECSNLKKIMHTPADAYLFDNRVSGMYGGTGKTFDWKALRLPPNKGCVIISGGLDSKNVKQAIHFFKPYGVDVSSGVESEPGKKDFKKMKEFIHNAKSI